MITKKEKIRLLKKQNDNVESEKKFLILKNNELRKELEKLKSKEFINFDGIYIKKKDIVRIAFIPADLENGVLKPMVSIDYWYGQVIENETMLFENIDTYEDFKKEIQELLTLYNYNFGEEKRVLFQKNLSIAPDEKGEPKVQTTIVGKDYY